MLSWLAVPDSVRLLPLADVLASEPSSVVSVALRLPTAVRVSV